jgi:hypothetical protein
MEITSVRYYVTPYNMLDKPSCPTTEDNRRIWMRHRVPGSSTVHSVEKTKHSLFGENERQPQSYTLPGFSTTSSRVKPNYTALSSLSLISHTNAA